MTNRLWTVVALVAAGLLLGCRARESEFYERTFTCASAAANPGCGTDRTGRLMTCYPAAQLGGQDFCAATCNAEASAGKTEKDLMCTSTGAALKRCRPSRNGRSDGECPAGLSCYRTDLTSDEGICIATQLCAVDEDCGDHARTVCATTLLRARYPQASVALDSLHCVQAGCKGPQSACPSGESCLGALVQTNPDTPDICIPNCDSKLNCPPNHVCYRKISGPAAPTICIPGTPGTKCTGDDDCLVGACLPTGEGFSLCSPPCTTDRDCVPWRDPNGSFVCIGAATGNGACVSVRAFAGNPCRDDADCQGGRRCTIYSPYNSAPMSLGECRHPCDEQSRCLPRGGVPHVCLKDRHCYPGRFGLPCRESSECAAGFACQQLPRSASTPDERICTIGCNTDEDCSSNPWTDNDGYCEAGICRLGFAPGAPCQRAAHCRTRKCLPAEGGTLKCG